MNPPAGQTGVDTSRYQAAIDASALYNNVAFWIIKATGGDDGLYVDSQFQHSLGGARALKFPRGYYHFAGGGNADAEADLFTNNLSPQAGEWLVLDWEIEYDDPVGWCLNWFMRVKQNTASNTGGVLYIDVDRLHRFDWSPVFNFGVSLWVANPSNVPVPYDYIMQQYGEGTRPGISGAVDLDFYHLDISTFGSFGWQPIPPTPPLPEPPVPVPAPPVEPKPVPAPLPTPAPTPTTPPTVAQGWVTRLINWLKSVFGV